MNLEFVTNNPLKKCNCRYSVLFQYAGGGK